MAADTTTPELRVSVTESSSVSRRVTVTVPAERVKRIRRSVAAQIARNVRLPGFRKGKLPESLIEKQFGPAIEQETRERVIQETYKEALDREGLHPVAQGALENIVVDEAAGDLTYDVSIEVQPTLNLARTGGFVVPRPSDQIAETDVDAVLERLRTDRATLAEVAEGAPDFQDEVTVDITPLEEGGETQEYRFALGEGQAIPAMEEAILSLSVGEEREFDISFPADFPEAEQAGQTQRMRIRLTEVRRRSFPELDDEFAASLGDFASLDALRERVRADLENDARGRAEAGIRDALVGQILEANPLEVPESMVGRYLDFMLGIDPDAEPKPARGGEQEERISQMRQVLRPQAEAALKRILVIEHLADREGLRATQDEVDERVEKLAEQSGRSASDVWLELEKRGQLQGLEAEITEDKVFAWLRQQNTVG